MLTRRNPAITEGFAVVVLENCSRVDASAEEVARCQIANIAHDGKSTTRIPFSIPIEELDPESHYGVRVHISRSGSSAVRVGDYISTESYPVRGNRRRTRIHVRAVG